MEKGASLRSPILQLDRVRIILRFLFFLAMLIFGFAR